MTGPDDNVMESAGSTQVCVTLDFNTTTEVNVTLETDDTPNSAQGKLYSTFKHKIAKIFLYFMVAIIYFLRAKKSIGSTEVYGNIY